MTGIWLTLDYAAAETPDTTAPGFRLRCQENADLVAEQGRPTNSSCSPGRRHEAAAWLLYGVGRGAGIKR